MDFLGIISLLFMVATSSGARVPATVQGAYTNPSDLCPSANELPSFAERLGPNLSDVERLVVFVYRKIGTNELISFIPSGEFQNCIQDYPETANGQVYNVNGITIETVFQNSYNKIISLNKDSGDIILNDEFNVDKDLPWNVIECSNCDSKPLNILENPSLNTDVINLPVISPLEQQNGNEEIYTPENEKDTIDFDKIVFDWNGQQPSDSPHVAPEEGSIQDYFFPNLPLEQSDNPGAEFVIQDDVVPGPVIDALPQIQIPNDLNGDLQVQQEVNKPSMIFPEDLTIADAFYPPRESFENTPLNEVQQPPEQPNGLYYPPIDSWFQEDTEDITETESFSDTNYNYIVPPSLYSNVAINRPLYKPPNVPSISSPGLPPLAPLGPPNVPVPSQWHLLNIPIIGPTKNHKNIGGHYKFPFPNQEKYNNRFWPFKHANLQNISSQSFDSWLMAQLNLLKTSGNEMPANAADINAVRKEIEEALKVNGFRVTGDGLLVYKNGMTSSLSNLKLRPLFIGKSFPYDSLLTGVNTDGKYKRPVTPLIEGLLLTLINPAKILGMVTLGVTALPHYMYVDGNKRVHLIREWNFQNYQKGLPKIQVPNFIRTNQLRYGEPKSNYLVETGASRPLSGVNGLEGGNIPVEPDELGFRIIGGSSATGTGTPIASKGRSGLDV